MKPPAALARILPWVGAALAAVGCASEPERSPAVELLPPTDRLVRISMALRGLRPSVDELLAVHERPRELEPIVDAYLRSEAFGRTVEDLHAELYLLRTDTVAQLPIEGILAERGYDEAQVYASTVQAPLELVREIVEQGRPYTEILTAPYTVADQVVADVYGLPYDPDGPTWQQTTWVDGRPVSGLLSDSQLWRRHVSNVANFNRGRANFVSTTFLCEDIAARDVLIEGGIDLNDPDAVAMAVENNETCVGCHAVLDPLAAFFWGYKEKLGGGAVVLAYDAGCEGNFFPGDPLRGSYEIAHWCYPLEFYNPAEADLWQQFDLRPPAYFGVPGTSMVDLGRLIAADPRFAQCTARGFFGWFAQVGRDDVPFPLASALQESFVEAGYDARQLAKAVVLSDEFLALRAGPGAPFVAGLQTVRPEQYARTVEDLTGFRWLSDQDPPRCAGGTDCWGAVDLTTSDLFGFRSMSGGIDGYAVTHPTHTATPTKAIVMARIAAEAAGWVVPAELALPAEERRLLGQVEASTTDEDTVRGQLAWLHARVLGEVVEPDGPKVDATFELWSAIHERSGTTERAWQIVVAALLQDVRMVYY